MGFNDLVAIGPQVEEEEEDRLRSETVENAQIAYQSILGKSLSTLNN